MTPTAEDGEVSYELSVGVKTAVIVSLPSGREVVVQVAVPTPGEAVVPSRSRWSPEPCSPRSMWCRRGSPPNRSRLRCCCQSRQQ